MAALPKGKVALPPMECSPCALKKGYEHAEIEEVLSGVQRNALVVEDDPLRAPCIGRRWSHVVPLVILAAVVGLLAPFMHTPLGEQPAFVPIMAAAVGCFGLLSVLLLVSEFRDSGDLRVLALSWAYMVSVILQLAWAATFPGVFASHHPLGSVPSTGPWLWVAWHLAFPVLLAVALAPWPSAANQRVADGRRRLLALIAVLASAAAGVLVAAAIVVLAGHLPVVIQGTNITPLVHIVGPTMIPTVVVATAATVVWAWRRSGLERWAGVAGAASLGDVLFTLSGAGRFSVGWYAGRVLTIVAAAVVLLGLLGELRGLKRRLVEDSSRLRILLDHTRALETLQHTLLGNMADGVMMQGSSGELLASNPAAHALSGLTADQMTGRAPADPEWATLRADGTPYPMAETPPMVTLREGVGRQEVLGVRAGDGSISWMSVHTVPVVMGTSGSVDFVVTSMTDVTERHARELALAQVREEKEHCVRRVLDAGGPVMVFQPIVELATGKPIGAEALARFPGTPYRPPNEWFAAAAEVGLGLELELAAIRAALSELDLLPCGAYLSLNAAPSTVISPELHAMLRGGVASRVVLELTEHAGVEDYAPLTEALDALRAMGARLAVDDAGSGFSSLQHILNLRPDIIKLDRALVEGIDTDPARRALAGSLMTFGAEIGAQVVAEGIENRREQTVLRRLGIRYGQGFHLGRPAPLPLAEDSPATATRLFPVPGY